MCRTHTLSYLLSFARSRLTTVRLASKDGEIKVRDAEEITSAEEEKEMAAQSSMLTLRFVYRKLQFDSFTSRTHTRARARVFIVGTHRRC